MIDEGHVASAKAQDTNLMALAMDLSVQYKWIVTGTPTGKSVLRFTSSVSYSNPANLMGLRFGEGSSASTAMTDSLWKALQRKVLSVEETMVDDGDIEMGNGERDDVPDWANALAGDGISTLDHLELQYPDASMALGSFTELQRWTKQDRNDLNKLGNMLIHFLNIARFSKPPGSTVTVFNSHVIAPLMHKSGPLPGSVRVLRQVMESVMVRHRFVFSSVFVRRDLSYTFTESRMSRMRLLYRLCSRRLSCSIWIPTLS